MNGFKAYRYYIALKLHFTKDKFNVFENNGYSADELFNCTLNDFPIIIKLYLGKQINPITMAMITDMYEPAGEWLNNPTLNLVLEQEIRTLYKMRGFFKYDKEKIEKIFKDFMHSLCGAYK